MANIKTTSALLFAAAIAILESTSKVSGNHITVDKAIVAAGEASKYRKGVILRALKMSHYHYGIDNGDSKTRKSTGNFGKTYSETRITHAVKNVLKNRDARIDALNSLGNLATGHHSTWYA